MVKKVDQLREKLESVDKELQALSTFRKTPQLLKFLRQLQGERSYILQKQQQASATEQQQELDRAERSARAQHNRSEKNKRNWRYVLSMSKTWGYTPKKVRSELKKRKKGLKSDIEDIKWRNPSP